MSVPFIEQHDVWADNNDPAWLDRNGLPDMRIVHGLSLDSARFTCARIRLLMPDARLWITNVHGDTVDTFETRGLLQSSASGDSHA